MITNPIKPLIVKQILIVSTLREDRSRNHIIFTSFIKRQLLLSLNYRILRFQGATFNHVTTLKWSAIVCLVMSSFPKWIAMFQLKTASLESSGKLKKAFSLQSKPHNSHLKWLHHKTNNSTSVPVRVYDFTLLNHQAYTGKYSAITNIPCFKQML